MSCFVGIDLGTINDWTAVGVLERYVAADQTEYHLRHLERHLGEPYTVIVERVRELLSRLEEPVIVVDGTGVGRPVIDLLAERGLSRLVPVIITGGDAVTEETVNGRREYRVPKRDLVGTLQVLLQNRQLRIPASIELRDELVTELQNFKVKIAADTGHASFEHWRSGDHDDLVLAIALACWYADSRREWPVRAVTKPILRRVRSPDVAELIRQHRE